MGDIKRINGYLYLTDKVSWHQIELADEIFKQSDTFLDYSLRTLHSKEAGRKAGSCGMTTTRISGCE